MGELYDLILSLPPKAYILLAVILGMILTEDLNPLEQRSLGGFFVLLGETIWVNATQTEVLDQKSGNSELARLRRDVDILKQRLL